MNLEISWTDKAIADLKQIYFYLSEKSEPAAIKAVNKIYSKISSLEKGFSKIGQREILLKNYPEEYRYLVSGNYKIIYSFLDQTIFINTIFDSRQNPKKINIK